MSEMVMEDYRVCLVDESGRESTKKIKSLRFEAWDQWHTLKQKEMKDGTYPVIPCLKCKSRDFSHNGRTINEYECVSCGAFTEFVFK